MSDGAWIFLSHSHKDFDSVAKVRNYLEHKGHHPLMFFLKCLSDDHEVDGLIRREIEARSWFVLCKSGNAEGSAWVKSEVEIIKGLSERTYSEIDIDDPNLDLDRSLFSLTRKATVYLSYDLTHPREKAVAERIRAALQAQDFGVFDGHSMNLRATEDVGERLHAELEETAKSGAMIVLVSNELGESPWKIWELNQYATLTQTKGKAVHIVPIYVDGLHPLRMLPPDLVLRFQGLDLSQRNLEEALPELIHSLRNYDWRRE